MCLYLGNNETSLHCADASTIIVDFLGIVDTSLLCVSVSLRLCVFKVPPQFSSSKNQDIMLVLASDAVGAAVVYGTHAAWSPVGGRGEIELAVSDVRVGSVGDEVGAVDGWFII